MKTDPCDILVLGGQEIPPNRGLAKVLQIPFTLRGLGEAHQLIPECKIIHYCPSRSIFSGRLNAEDIQAIEKLFNIPPSELEEEFTPDQEKGLRLVCLRKAFSDLGVVLSAGGQLAVCVPEDFPDWTPAEKGLVTLFIPAFMATRDDKWRHRLEGPQDLLALTAEQKSALVFTVNKGYLVKHESIFDPDFIPSGASCLTGDVEAVKDRKDRDRIVRMSIGAGKLVLCPELYWNRFLESVGAIASTENEKKVAAPAQPPHKEIAPSPAETVAPAVLSSKQPHAAVTASSPGALQAAPSSSGQQDLVGIMEASQPQPERILQALLPMNPKTLSEWNTILRWNGRGALRNTEELAEYLDRCAHIRKTKPDKLGEADMPPTESGRDFDPAKFRSVIEKKTGFAQESGNRDLIAFFKMAMELFCRTVVKV